MEIKNYKKRIADNKIEHYLKLFGAVCIEGPKYCGKTWAGRNHSNSEVLLHKTTGEASNNVELAKMSPSIILEGKKPKLIDEWQEATNLWDEIREVDSIIELENGEWCAFEIKLGANKIDEAAKNLLNLKQKIEKENGKIPSVLCVICGLSNIAYQRPDGVYVVPITALKP